MQYGSRDVHDVAINMALLGVNGRFDIYIGKPCKKTVAMSRRKTCVLWRNPSPWMESTSHLLSQGYGRYFLGNFLLIYGNFGRQTCRDVLCFCLQTCNYWRHLVCTDAYQIAPGLVRNISFLPNVLPYKISLKYQFCCCAYLCVKFRRLYALRNEFWVNFRLCCPVGKTSVLLLTTPFLQVMN
jgi:hypothetical protein